MKDYAGCCKKWDITENDEPLKALKKKVMEW